jgi:hypothetical protein
VAVSAEIDDLGEFSQAFPSSTPLAERAGALLAGPLAAKRMLAAFYSGERLMSVAARRDWVEPDVAPLRVESVLGIS